MNVELFYESNIYFQPENIGVLWLHTQEMLEMERNGDRWQFVTQLPEGEYHYRFVINEELEITDPYNNVMEPDEEGTLWSVLIINEAGQRMYNTNQYGVHLEEYVLKNRTGSSALSKEKKSFCLGQDRQISAGFTFTDITGIHSVTAAWYTPEGELFQYAENVLYEDAEEERAVLWFWLDMEDTKEAGQGMWKLRLFIDGQYILEDLFTIYTMQQTRIYQSV